MPLLAGIVAQHGDLCAQMRKQALQHALREAQRLRPVPKHQVYAVGRCLGEHVLPDWHEPRQQGRIYAGEVGLGIHGVHFALPVAPAR